MSNITTSENGITNMMQNNSLKNMISSKVDEKDDERKKVFKATYQRIDIQ